MMKHDQNSDLVIAAIRRLIRAVDLHSRKLVTSHGLTGPQALIIRALQHNEVSAGELAQQVRLSQGTVTDILNRLEQKELVKRSRDTRDRRRVQVQLTRKGQEVLLSSPPLLQERFAQRFNELEDWEQTQLLASLQRIASMMDADDLDAAPVLSSGAITATAKATENILEPDVSAEDQTLVQSDSANRKA
jgi:DNA-binding MarR family transcriptional regulator